MHLGDRIQFTGRGIEISLHFAAVTKVRTPEGRVYDALLIQRWENSTSSSYYTDAIDLDSLTYVWSIRHCIGPDSECKRNKAYFFRDPVEFFRFDLVAADDSCVVRPGLPPASRNPLLVPSGLVERYDREYCPNDVIPRRLFEGDSEVLVRSTFEVGTSTPVPTTGIRSEPIVSAHDPWDFHSPPPQEWPTGFTTTEAIRAVAGDSRFREFTSRNPDYYLQASYLTSERGGDFVAPMTEPIPMTNSWTRVLTFQAPSGAGMTFEMTKTKDIASGTRIMIDDVHAGQGIPTLFPERMGTFMSSPLSAARAADALLPGDVWDVHVLTALGDGRGGIYRTENHFLYRVVVEPTADKRTSDYFTDVVFVRSDTGHIVTLLGEFSPWELVLVPT